MIPGKNIISPVKKTHPPLIPLYLFNRKGQVAEFVKFDKNFE